MLCDLAFRWARNSVGALAGLGLLVATQASAESALGWPAYGGSPGGGHFTTAEQIDAGNVGALEVAWIHRSGDFRVGGVNLLESDSEADSREAQLSPGSFMGTPIVVNDTLYYCTPFNRIFALDPVSGAERWVFDPGVDMSKEPLTNCRGVSSWQDPETPTGLCSHRIIAGTLDGRIFALDGATGARCPDFGINGEIDLGEGLTAHEETEYAITSAPAILGDRLITGARIADSYRKDVPSGVVRAYDVRNGAFLWGWNPVPPGSAERDAAGNYVAGTTNVWSTISVDMERNLVIVPTGNSSPDYYGGDRSGSGGGDLDHYSSSVVALDGDSGAVVWHYQTVHHDIWDYDVPAQPTLVDLEIDGVPRPAVVQVTKMGLTFVLDRETGKPLHPVEERPVPQDGAVPGEYLSPTQPFPLKPAPLHQLGIGPEDAWGFTFWDRGRCRHRAHLHPDESGGDGDVSLGAGRQQLGRASRGSAAQDHDCQYQAPARGGKAGAQGAMRRQRADAAIRLALLCGDGDAHVAAGRTLLRAALVDAGGRGSGERRDFVADTFWHLEKPGALAGIPYEGRHRDGWSPGDCQRAGLHRRVV